MSIRAVTIDFHDTIAACDRWFRLEVRDLVPAVLDRLDARGLVAAPPPDPERARAIYRELRDAIIASGEEQDALACAMHTLGALGLDLPSPAVAGAIDGLMAEALDDTAPQPGIVGAVRGLRATGLRCAVVSSAIHHAFLEWTLARFGLRDAFGAIVTSASCGYYKSRPEIYAAALRALDVPASEAVHVGDSYRFDVQGARRAGMRTIWYASTERALAQPDNEADATIADLATLPAVVAALGGTARRRWWSR